MSEEIRLELAKYIDENSVTSPHAKTEGVSVSASVAAEPCHCVRCGDCHGQGNYRIDIGGFDDLETCDTCGGSGIVETCDRCQLLQELDYENS